MNLTRILLKLLALADEVDHIRSVEQALNELIRLVKLAKALEAKAKLVSPSLIAAHSANQDQSS